MKKKLLAIIIALVLVATLTCVLVACGETEPSPEPTPTPAPSVEEVKVVDILQNNAAFQNMDNAAAEKIVDEIKERVASDCNVAKSKVELVDVNYDDANAELVTVVAKIDGKKVVLNRYESERLGEYSRGDKETLVLNKANYTAESKVDEDKQSEVDAEFTVAVNAILAKLSNLSEEATLVKANEIFSEYASDEVIPGFDGIFGCDEFFLSGVREDGTVVAFTYTKGSSNDPLRLQGYQDHVLKVEGRENMTNDEIMAQIKAGNFTKETRTIDPSKTYTAPALEEKPVVKTTTVGEIYDANFANVDFSAKLEEAFQSIYNRGFKNSVGTTMFYNIDEENKISAYYNLFRNNKNSFNMMKFDLTEEIAGYLTGDVKTLVLKEAQLNATQEVEKDQSYECVGNIQLAIDSISEKIAALGDIELKTIETKGYITNTTDNIEPDDFNEKLCPDKEVIATYVGAQTGKTNDSAHEFNTGYYTQFKVVVVYLENDDVVIENSVIYVPYYNNSTKESLYNSLLNGKENKNYKIAMNEKETIKNATIVKQKESSSEAV